ncbi:MAG: hypothetical protein JO072_16835 [Parafilimonas sp.]|nr:hypothetical protein [Parafilimonas sp.]
MATLKSNSFNHFIVFIFLFFSGFNEAKAQYSLQDSLIESQTKDSIVALFDNSFKSNISLYNGSEYLYGGHNVKGFAYYRSADILKGSIMYNGNLYDDVPMRFDLTTNELVILDYTGNYPIKLVSSKIDFFILDSNRFINAANTYKFTLPQTTGFYEVLYNNKSTVLARKEKQLVLASKLDENDSHYQEFDWYYIYANDKLYKVDNEKSVLNVFNNKKAELKKFIKINKISFRKNFENAIISTAAYYDELKN